MQDPKQQQIKVSNAVRDRLPRYYRFLRELLEQDILRISSSELSRLMNVTASQIRQDLNCFGGFGQQGYGYNVKYLYGKIADILGANEAYNAVIIGAGHLGYALAGASTFSNRGVILKALFDVDEKLIGSELNGLTVHSMDELEEYCRENRVDIAVLTVPKSVAGEIGELLANIGIKGIWNFTGVELKLMDRVTVQNVHLGDRLMTLCYEIKNDNKSNKDDMQ